MNPDCTFRKIEKKVTACPLRAASASERIPKDEAERPGSCKGAQPQATPLLSRTEEAVLRHPANGILKLPNNGSCWRS